MSSFQYGVFNSGTGLSLNELLLTELQKDALYRDGHNKMIGNLDINTYDILNVNNISIQSLTLGDDLITATATQINKLDRFLPDGQVQNNKVVVADDTRGLNNINAISCNSLSCQSINSSVLFNGHIDMNNYDINNVKIISGYNNNKIIVHGSLDVVTAHTINNFTSFDSGKSNYFKFTTYNNVTPQYSYLGVDGFGLWDLHPHALMLVSDKIVLKSKGATTNEIIITDNNVNIHANLSLNNNKISNLGNGTSANDAINKGQFDTALNTKYDKNGGGLNGSISFTNAFDSGILFYGLSTINESLGKLNISSTNDLYLRCGLNKGIVFYSVNDEILNISDTGIITTTNNLNMNNKDILNVNNISTNTLTLNDTLLNVSGDQINKLNVAVDGVTEASKFLICDSGRNINNINNLFINSLILDNIVILVSGDQINKLNVAVDGVTEASKVLICDSARNISNINNTSTNTLTLNDTLLNVSGDQINKLNVAVDGVTEASKFLICDSGRNINNINNLFINSLILDNIVILVSGNQINKLNVAVDGVTEGSKFLICDSNRDISNINNTSTNTLTLNNTLINVSGDQINKLNVAVDGVTEASKFLICDSGRNISNINNLDVQSLTLNDNLNMNNKDITNVKIISGYNNNKIVVHGSLDVVTAHTINNFTSFDSGKSNYFKFTTYDGTNAKLSYIGIDGFGFWDLHPHALMLVSDKIVLKSKGATTNEIIITDNNVNIHASLNLNNNKISNLSNGTSANDAINKGQFDTALNTKYDKTGGPISGNINFTNALNEGAIIYLGGSSIKEPLNKLTLESSDELIIKSASSKSIKFYSSINEILFIGNTGIITAKNNIDMNNFKIINASTPTNPNDLCNKSYVDQFVKTTATSDLNMNNFKIINVSNGTSTNDAINKSQLDTGLSGKLNITGGALSGLLTTTINDSSLFHDYICQTNLRSVYNRCQNTTDGKYFYYGLDGFGFSGSELGVATFAVSGVATRFSFLSNWAEKMHISNIGVGTNGLKATSDRYNRFGGWSGFDSLSINDDTTISHHLVVGGGAVKSSGGTTWATYSDMRIKTNIQDADINTTISIFKQLNFKTYNYSQNAIDSGYSCCKQLGLIAQDLELIPEIQNREVVTIANKKFIKKTVTKKSKTIQTPEGDKTIEEDETNEELLEEIPDLRTINISHLQYEHMMLTKHLLLKIEDLEARIKILEG